jgi:hypothetical protein
MAHPSSSPQMVVSMGLQACSCSDTQWSCLVARKPHTYTQLHSAANKYLNPKRSTKPYLLEFAALKFSLDKFSDLIWGYPVELETDCQALRDHLLNDKLNSTHAQWRDGVLAHQIIDVQHRPGHLNPVADGISRKYVNSPTEQNDGHDWTVSEDWEV